MTENLTESDKEEIKDLFKLFDQDDSGSVSYDELAKIVRGMGHNPTEKELEEMFKQLDVDGSGSIDCEEFTKYYGNILYDPHRDQAAELKQAFEIFDKDGNGYIDAGELTRVLNELGDNHMSDAEVRQIMKEFDLEQDGKLSYSEFVASMCEK